MAVPAQSRRRFPGGVMPSWTALMGISVLVAAGTLQPVVDATGVPVIVEPTTALPKRLVEELEMGKKNVSSFATNLENIFVTAMSRKDFSVMDPDSVVAGVGTEDMLPEAVLRVDSKAAANGLKVIGKRPLTEGQRADFIPTVFVREPTGTILDFVETEDGFRCPARNYGIRARVREIRSDDPDSLTIFYHQYDAGGHVFVDEVGFVTVERGNFISASSEGGELARDSLITFLCREYNDDVLVYVGWPQGVPVFVMDEDWRLPVRIDRITTIKTSNSSTVAVVAMLKVMGPASEKIVDFETGEPLESPFLYAGRAVSKNRAFSVLTSRLEKTVCSLIAVTGQTRPSLHCEVKDLEVPVSVIKKAGQARTAKLGTAIASGLLAGAALFMALAPPSRKASLVPLALSIASAGGAIASKVTERKRANEALKQILPARHVEFEHLVFIKADDFPVPTPEENEKRKVKLLLTFAEEKRREDAEEERIRNLRKQMRWVPDDAKRG